MQVATSDTAEQAELKRKRVARPGRRMRRVCTGTLRDGGGRYGGGECVLVHYERTVWPCHVVELRGDLELVGFPIRPATQGLSLVPLSAQYACLLIVYRCIPTHSPHPHPLPYSTRSLFSSTGSIFVVLIVVKCQCSHAQIS